MKIFNQFKLLAFYAFMLLFACCRYAPAQSPNKLQSRCPSSPAFQNLTLTASGNANFTTCSGGRVQINGVPIPNTASGAGTANALPVWASNNVLSDSFATQTSTSFNIFNSASDDYYFRITKSGGAAGFALSNLAGNRGIYLNSADLTLDNNGGNILLRPATSANSFVEFTSAGSFNMLSNTTPANAQFNLSSETAGLRFDNGITLTAIVGDINIGDTNAESNGTLLTVSDTNQIFSFGNRENAGVIDVVSVNKFNLQRTITNAGTTGSQTINKPNGSVNFAAGAGAAGLTVTNSTVTANSLVWAIAQTNDTTCSVKNVVAGAGSFVIRMTANCTAETKVAFWVTN